MACFECKTTLVCQRSGDCCRFDRKDFLSEEEDLAIRSAMYLRTGIIYPVSMDRFTISILDEEKRVLERWAKKLELPVVINPKRVVIKDNKVTVLDWFLDHDACPFLEGANVCRIYEDRPLICRVFPRMEYTDEEKARFADVVGDKVLSFKEALEIVNTVFVDKQKY